MQVCRRIQQQQHSLGGTIHRPVTLCVASPSCRQFSTTRAASRTSRSILHSSSNARPAVYGRYSAAVAPAVRWKSTAPELLDDADVAAMTNESPPVSILDQYHLNPLPQNILPEGIPEHHLPDGTIGYLHSLGLDNGIGPTSVMQWVLEHVHVYSALPWGASIMVSAIVFRLAVLFPMKHASDNIARMKLLTEDTENKRRMEELKTAQDRQEKLRIAKEMQVIRQKYGVKVWKVALNFIQIPFAFGNFIMLREMAALPVPGLTDGGFAWFENLAVADPYYVLPALSAASVGYMMRKGSEAGNQTILQGPLKPILFYGVPTISFAFLSTMPAALSLHFATTSFLALWQAMLFQNESFRAMIGIFPLKRAALADSPVARSVLAAGFKTVPLQKIIDVTPRSSIPTPKPTTTAKPTAAAKPTSVAKPTTAGKPTKGSKAEVRKPKGRKL